MAGPKAPKDPERKRPYFYIMKDKDIYGCKGKWCSFKSDG